MAEERLQKIMSRSGYGSRRACEEIIAAGRVTVDGLRVGLGSKADPAVNRIAVDGRVLSKTEPEKVYIALYKPRGVLSDVDPDDPRNTVRDLIELPGQLYSVGRLDLDSEGLILMTNDGELTNKLTHPRYGHEKEYQVLVADRPDDGQMDALRHGIVLEDGHRTAPATVNVISPNGKGAWLRIVLREGRKRQIREMCKRIGLPVVRLIRVRIGTLLLGDLRPGKWRHLTEDEVKRLKESTRGHQAAAGGEKPRRMIERKPFERRPSDRRPTERKPGETRTGGNAPTGRKSAERKPTEQSPADRNPFARKPFLKK